MVRIRVIRVIRGSILSTPFFKFKRNPIFLSTLFLSTCSQFAFRVFIA